MRSLDALVEEWVRHGVLTPEAAENVRSYEASRTPEPGPHPRANSSRRSALSELLGYLGASLAVVAVAFILTDLWSSLGHPVRIAMVGLLTAVVTGAGIVLWRSPSAGAQRLVSVLMVAGVSGVGWLAWLLVRGDRVYRLYVFTQDWSGLAIGVACVASAIPLYVMRRRALALVVAVTSMMIGCVAVVTSPLMDVRFEWAPLAWIVVGLLVFVGAHVAAVAPRSVAYVVAAIAMLMGAQVASVDSWRLGMLVTGMVVALTLGVYAVRYRGALTSLIPAAVGMFIFVPQFVWEVFEDAIVVWGAVLVLGLVFVGLAVVLLRFRRREA